MEQKRLLIVDDETNIRFMLSITLESDEFQVDTAANGAEALAKIRQQDYALMLLDIKMPGMPGMEVLANVRKTHPELPVIMITAHGTIENAVEAMKLGAVDFIRKPFTPQEIRAVVTNVLERQCLQADQAIDYASLVEFAKKCLGNRQFHDAETYLRRAITHAPQRPEAVTLLGALLELKNEKLEALKLYRAAVALDPTYQLARQNLSRATTWESTQGIMLE
jgi:DNA-binding NtrC family response regulator